MAYKDPLDPRAREARRRHYEKNKEQYFERNKKHKEKLVDHVLEIKNKTGCADCGVLYFNEPWLSEFDHIGTNKEKNIAVMLRDGSTLAKLIAEIEKCELVCVLCHRRRTAKRGNWLPNKYKGVTD